jgi:hypothetical protein
MSTAQKMGSRWMRHTSGGNCQYCGAPDARWRQGYGGDPVCGACREEIVRERQTPEREDAGYVYALRCGPWIKIGTSFTPEKRMDEISRGCPPTEALYILGGGHSLEKALHERLRAFRVKNEWFDASVEVLAALKQEYERQIAKDRERGGGPQLPLLQ